MITARMINRFQKRTSDDVQRKMVAPFVAAPSIATRFVVKGLAVIAVSVSGGTFAAEEEVTFHEDIQPIIRDKCQGCHRDGGNAPMPLFAYDEVQPYGALIQYKTGLVDKMGVMPPWYVNRDIGIQEYKSDPSLSFEQIDMIAEWVESGMPRGNPANAPEPREFGSSGWQLGEPDIVIESADITMGAREPDWWGSIEPIDIGNEEDRYIKSVEVREVNDAERGDSTTSVGGGAIVHHWQWAVQGYDDEGNPIEDQVTRMPIHELGRNPDEFGPKSGRLLPANAKAISSNTIHLHAIGKDTTAQLQIGFHLHPKGYEPEYSVASISLGDGQNISIAGNESGQILDDYAVLEHPTMITHFEPHLHGPGVRQCLEVIWGNYREVLSCVGYDHNWVLTYAFEDGHQPLLPEGAILHTRAYMDNTDANMNVPDPRNWQGAGNRSVTNMFIDLGVQLELTQDQFLEEMAMRRKELNLGPNDHVIGCPLCTMPLVNPLELTDEEKQEMTAAEIMYWEVEQ